MALNIIGIDDISINCADLACTKEFYAGIGMLQSGDTLSPLQSGEGFGLANKAQYLSHRLSVAASKNNATAESNISTHLNVLQWVQPPPEGDAPVIPNQPGYARLAFYLPQLTQLHQQLLTQHTPALSDLYYDQPSGLRWCYCRDPSGSLIELVEQGSETKLAYVVLNCHDLAKSVAWYNVLFDLQPGPVQRLGVAPQLLDNNKPGQVISVQMNLELAGANSFGLVLQQWQQPEAQGQPHKKPNHSGICRLAYVVENLTEAYEYLRSERIDCVFAPYQWQTSSDTDKRMSLLMYDPTGACIELRAPIDKGLQK